VFNLVCYEQKNCDVAGSQLMMTKGLSSGVFVQHM